MVIRSISGERWMLCLHNTSELWAHPYKCGGLQVGRISLMWW